ncbi:restriction endonuclease subunit S [Streptococcus sp. Marseille-Q5619]|nr:restriction endonuclease subunit S [Streptococcus sp. Marseille-Q5619]
MSKLKLTDVEWGEFFIGGLNGLFDITSTKSGIDKNKLNIDVGLIPYITRTDMQNGINMFITDKQNNRYNIDEGNVITIGLDTQTVFYQPTAFYTGQNIQVLRNNNLNKYTAMFIIPSIKIQMQKFNWGGNGATLGRLNRTRLILPIDSQGQPNWQFMEDYIKQEQKQQAQKIIDYYERKLIELAGDVVGLDKVEWKTFKLGDIFDLVTKSSKGLNHLEKNTSDGISYVGATNRNNGVLDFVKRKENLIYSGNAIAFIRNGEGSMGYSVYKKEDFIASQDITVGYNQYLNEYNAKFITTIADQVRGKYNFGYKRNQERLKRETLVLPSDEKGNPNFQYMSDFVKKLELDKVQEVIEYIYIYIYIRMMNILKEKVCEISWKDFWIEDVCEIKSGVRLTKANQEIGLRPFVGASDSDNGVTAFVSNKNKSLDANVLGVNYNGSVVENFYHPYEAIFSDDVKRLKWKDGIYGNKYTYLFLKQMILSQKIKYAYGYKFNGERMKRQKIMLPVAETGLPDYNYMTSYMQKQELEQIFKILNYLNKENTHV